MFDRETRRPRGFGFVTFEDASVCDQLLQMGNSMNHISNNELLIGRMEMRGKMMEIKKAQPRSLLQDYSSSSRYVNGTAYYDNSAMTNTSPDYFSQNIEPDYAVQFDSQQQYDRFDQHHYQENTSFDASGAYGFAPPTPSPYYNVGNSTPVTPQAAYDIAHHMMFLSQLLATPTLINAAPHIVSPMVASPMMLYGQQQQQSFSHYRNDFRDGTVLESVSENIDQSKSDLKSPSKKVLQTGKPFQIGGAVFYPEKSPLSPSIRQSKPDLSVEDNVSVPVTPL